MSSMENLPSSAALRDLRINGSAASGAHRSATGTPRKGEGTHLLVPSDISER
jgi:hypothetical protein